jgi:hypothetical protein
MKPRNETGALLHAPVPKLQLTGAYHFPPSLQSLGNGTKGEVKHYDFFNHDREGHCLGCGRIVTNDSLGGHDGRPLSGKLWCLQCADCASQLLLRFGGAI